MKYESNVPIETFELGKKFGQNAKKGEIYCLCGDLGTGKTLFSQGFAKGLEIEEPICSPTFTILQEYESGKLPFYHFDVYRIAEPEEMDEIGFQDYLRGDGVCLIEWAELIREEIPPEATWISIEKDLERGMDFRKIFVKSYGVGTDENNSN